MRVVEYTLNVELECRALNLLYNKRASKLFVYIYVGVIYRKKFA